MKFKIKAYNLQELGQRTNQEDSLYPALGKSKPEDRLFILCDGMGGHEKGEVASATVCETISRVILSTWHPNEALSDELFLQALSAAYDALDAKDNGEERKMGTTLTFLCLHANGATVAHIGDSRIYQLRPASKNSPAQIVFRTQDHSLVNDLVKIGEITEEEAKHHPQKNVITRAMQPCQEQRAKADIAHLTDVQTGDYFFMCSDGMLEQSTDDNILNIITKSNVSDEQKLEMLRRVTEENKDNHTAHLIYISDVANSVVEDVSVCTSSTESHDMLISATFSKTKKNKIKKLIIWTAIAVVIVFAISVISFLVFDGHKAEKNKNHNHIIKVDTIKENNHVVITRK
ncbi:PP2C family protein-serine/threonine phosphatase [Prevotella sp.]|uniref:PP2C family protein-serine/threonine phosphatase n=1 Tax=Prevotella sp. TaxID=59823 RepID=UPI002E76483B|nr:protein phosphatase 2C domain-containing protein [Prevotella sp.]MEE0670141.1 protein phosphatase 2C domain-containing protein [Prevotella sp.]